MATLKTCFRCGAEKPRTEFYAHPEMGDGLLGKCKPCTREDARNARAANSDYYREYDKTRYRNDPERRRKARESYAAACARHPERRRAANAVANAVKRGEIKPQPCWVCGERAEGHHPDYSRPLDVVWLCTLHHRQTHNMLLRFEEKAA